MAATDTRRPLPMELERKTATYVENAGTK